jgi:phosphoribosylformylglycinamidine synthase
MVELELDDPQQLQAMCEKLLANPLVEDYEVQLLEGGGSARGENGRSG